MDEHYIMCNGYLATAFPLELGHCKQPLCFVG